MGLAPDEALGVLPLRISVPREHDYFALLAIVTLGREPIAKLLDEAHLAFEGHR